MKYLLIVLGGGAGSLTRFLVSTAIVARYGNRFPMAGTMAINISGSFVIGILMTLITERFDPTSNLRPLLVIGFLGGYTTFSSFEWETYFSVRSGAPWMAIVNVAGSVVLGYLAVWLGAMLARR